MSKYREWQKSDLSLKLKGQFSYNRGNRANYPEQINYKTSSSWNKPTSFVLTKPKSTQMHNKWDKTVSSY